MPRYETIEVLGEGQTSRVVRALDTTTGGEVALKRGERDALTREFVILRGLSHPNIVRAFEIDEDDEGSLMVMEVVIGDDLATYVRADVEPMPSPTSRRNLVTAFGYELQEEGRSAFLGCTDAGYRTLRRRFADLASALRGVHAAGYVHLDVARENVLATAEGLTLIDFGITRELDPDADAQEGFVGNAVYLAPELGLGRPPNAACDWYSAGVLLFECLTGARPFDGGGGEVMVRKQSISAPDPHSLVDDIPQDLHELCVGLLKRDPSKRTNLD